VRRAAPAAPAPPPAWLAEHTRARLAARLATLLDELVAAPRSARA